MTDKKATSLPVYEWDQGRWVLSDQVVHTGYVKDVEMVNGDTLSFTYTMKVDGAPTLTVASGANDLARSILVNLPDSSERTGTFHFLNKVEGVTVFSSLKTPITLAKGDRLLVTWKDQEVTTFFDVDGTFSEVVLWANEDTQSDLRVSLLP